MAQDYYIHYIAIVAFCFVFSSTWGDIAINTNKANSNASTNDNNNNKVNRTPVDGAKTLVGTLQAANVTVPSTTAAPKCICDAGLTPRLGENGKPLEICPECKCKHEARNTTLIKVVVIIVIWIISILVIYMLFLMCLDPLLNKRVKSNYQEHTNEDDDTNSTSTSPYAAGNNQELNSRANVLNRVGHQTDKWKRQVREQRRHIYDRHTMLN